MECYLKLKSSRERGMIGTGPIQQFSPSMHNRTGSQRMAFKRRSIQTETLSQSRTQALWMIRVCSAHNAADNHCVYGGRAEGGRAFAFQASAVNSDGLSIGGPRRATGLLRDPITG